MDIRLNIYDENNRLVGIDYLTEKGKWMHKWVHKGELEKGSWRGHAVGENDINWRYESALDKPSEREQANEILPHVSGSALLNELIPLLISYFYPTTPTSNSDEMFKKRLQIIEILNDFKAD